MIWTSDHLFSPPFFPQQATCTCKKFASYWKPMAQMLQCHTGIFIGVHWGTLNDFYSHSLKVRCCKFTCSKILMRWRDGGTAEEWMIPEMSFRDRMLFKGALLTWKCPEEPAFSKAESKAFFFFWQEKKNGGCSADTKSTTNACQSTVLSFRRSQKHKLLFWKEHNFGCRIPVTKRAINSC